MAKRYIIYCGNVQATYMNGQAPSGVSDTNLVEFIGNAGTPNNLGIYIKTPLQVMQALRYELFGVDEALAENMSGIWSVPNVGWNPSQAVQPKQYQWSESSSSRTSYQSTIGSYASDMSTSANMKSGYSLPEVGVATIKWAQTFSFSLDDSNYDTMAAPADGEHVKTYDDVWFVTYISGVGNILKRLSFPEMIDPIDPYQEWWIKGSSLPIRLNFPKMYDYSKVESNIYLDDKKMKTFFIGDDKVKAIYLGDKKVMG